MKQSAWFVGVVLLCTIGNMALGQEKTPLPNIIASPQRLAEERLSFQTHAAWSPRVQLNADVAMVYGIDLSLPDRIRTWKDRGYRIHLMTGVSWGGYQDYLYGNFDGKNHEDEAQTDRNNEPLRHNPNTDIYYMSPGESYGKYLAAGVLRAIEAGVEAVHLEEPEFWVHSGWEPDFKREWEAFYGEPWVAPDSSPDAQWRASKLKYYLYRRALAQIFDAVHEYEKETGREIPCYVPTHSQINYAQWRIVSPESSLLEIGCDGYIAQVWTGTARSPNLYNGKFAERTFETAYLEYGAMQNLVRASGRRVWYLNDPVEDNPSHTWVDYRGNWECTLTASLLQPEVFRYEIMPWPDRIFMGQYPAALPKELEGNNEAAEQSERVGIPAEYETELQAVISALGDMKQPESAVKWEISGTEGVGVFFSDTMMFQRGSDGASDAHLGSLYGLTIPLVKHGIPVEPVQIENVTLSNDSLDRYRILVLTYEGQKPPVPEFHETLALWVRQGGVLVVIDDDKDPFNSVREWWNTGEFAQDKAFATPRAHLFATLGVDPSKDTLTPVEKGFVRYVNGSPAALTRDPDGGAKLRRYLAETAAAVGTKWTESNVMALRRGPYVVLASMDESLDEPVATLPGTWISLFDPTLSVMDGFTPVTGTRALLLDLSMVPAEYTGVLAAACRVKSQSITEKEVILEIDGTEGSQGVLILALPERPATVSIGNKAIGEDTQSAECWDYDVARKLLRIRWVNRADGVGITVAVAN